MIEYHTRMNPEQAAAAVKALASVAQETRKAGDGRVHRGDGRLCVVCGAKVRNMNPRTKTCDTICTKALHNGLTREQQTWATE